MMNKKESPRIVSAKYLLVIPALAAALLIVQISGLQATKSVINENPVAVTTATAPPVVKSAENKNPAKAPVKKTVKEEPVAQDTLALKAKLSYLQEQLKKDNSSIIPAPANLAIEDSSLINLIKKYNQMVLERARLLSYAKEDAPIIEKFNERLALMKQDIITLIRTLKYDTSQYTNTGEQNRLSNRDSQQAETMQVSGNVTSSKDGKPLPGVAIVVKGSSTGTVTDLNGNYTMNVPKNAFLQFSNIGMATQEVKINNRSQINIMMNDETGKPLYIVDGREADGIQNISPETIESVSILNGASATQIYGDKGKNGVVLITLKK